MCYTACFTGHRPQNLICGFDETHPACIKIKHQLKRMIIGLIEKKNATHFVSGGAMGVDMWAAEAVIELKEKYPYITLEVAIPCRGQDKYWSVSMQRRYKEMLIGCDRVNILQERYTPDCMQKRNRYMVDKSDFVVAVWNGRSGGTGSTVQYAVGCGKTVYCIGSIDFKMRKI